MEIVGMTPAGGESHTAGPPGAKEAYGRLIHDGYLALGEIMQLLHQACHDGELTLSAVMTGKSEAGQILDLILCLAVRADLAVE